jgi:hypothetical protein
MYKKILIVLFVVFLYGSISGPYAFWDVLNFWQNNVSNTLKWWNGDLVFTTQNIVWYIIGLMYFISVIFWLYGWFIILTSWWEEEKVKKWRKIIIFMCVWLICIFLASSLVNWVIDVMWSNQISGKN